MTTAEPWRASVLTLFPEMFPGPLGASLAGRAIDAGIWSLTATNIRDFAADRHRTVDADAGIGKILVRRTRSRSTLRAL
jgi:tRNA (guanine37-N1)-methyltransferase